VSETFSEKETSLRQQVEQSEGALQDFEQQLQVINNELEELTRESQQYDLLSKACQSLEQLDALNATQLFWGDSGQSVDHLGNVRRKVDHFYAQVDRVESRRQAVIDHIGNHSDDLDDLHYDLESVIAQEQRRKNNWVIEREPEDWPYRRQIIMPWTRGFEEDKRFRRTLVGSMVASLALAGLIGTVALPVVERSVTNELPERVAKLVREQRIPPPMPEPVEVPIEPLEELPPPEPEFVQEQPPEPSDEPVIAEIQQPETKAEVKSKGILAFRDSFANRAKLAPTAQLGSQARLSAAGETAIGRSQRSMVTTSAPGSSGGINLASISRDVGGGGGGGQGIDGVQVSRVASSIGGGDGPSRPLSGGASAGRTDEEIQIVFDRYKAALYRLYNRELRKDPTLRGQLVLRLTIEPDGSVSLCQLQASDMNAPALGQQIVDRVLSFDFGAKQDIVAMTIIYPIDFLPAA